MDQLDAFTTFPFRPPAQALRDVRLLARTPYIFLNDLIELAERRQKPDWVKLLQEAMKRRKTVLSSHASP